MLKKLIEFGLNDLRINMRRDPFKVQQRLIDEFQKFDITIFDVGANKGQTAERYRSIFPNADIYCFEPFLNSIIELKRKFSDDKSVHIVSKAVSDITGKATFYVNELDQTNSLLPRTTSARRYYPKYAETKDIIDIEVVTLDRFISDNEISAIDILKFDIQGGEMMALRGAKNLLENGSVLIIYTEVFFIPHYEESPLFHDLWSFLKRYDFSLFDIFNIKRATNGQIRYGDAIFVSESLRHSVIDKYPEEP